MVCASRDFVMIICVDGDGTEIQLRSRLLESDQKIGKETVIRLNRSDAIYVNKVLGEIDIQKKC